MTENTTRTKDVDDTAIGILWRYFSIQPANANRNALIEYYVPFGHSVSDLFSRRYQGFGVCKDDCRQNGLVGLMDAVTKYETKFGARFETYASFRIRGELVNGLKNYCVDLDLFRAEHRKEGVLALSIPEDTRTLEGWSGSIADMAISASLSLDDDLNIVDPKEHGYDESNLFSRKVWSQVEKLSENEGHAIIYHYLYECSFAEIAEILDGSKSRVYKDHNQAIRNLRGFLSKDFDILV